MSALPQDTRLTETEYFALLEDSLHRDDGMKYELIDGYVYAMSGASANHVRITTNLVTQLNIASRGTPCEVFDSDMSVKAQTDTHYYFPDVSVVCGEAQFVEDASVAMLLNPTLLIEVLSPTSEIRDRTTKFATYRRLESLQTYVLVSQNAPYIECYTRRGDGSWLYTTANDLSASVALEPLKLSLALADVYERVTFPDPDEDTDDERPDSVPK